MRKRNVARDQKQNYFFTNFPSCLPSISIYLLCYVLQLRYMAHDAPSAGAVAREVGRLSRGIPSLLQSEAQRSKIRLDSLPVEGRGRC